MAGRKSAGNKTGWGDIVFASFEMTDEIEQSYEAWLKKSAPNTEECLDQLTTNDYKVSLNYDPEHESFSVALTGKADARRNSGVCMMTYSDSVQDAIALALFKAAIVYDGGDWPLSGQKRRRR